MKTEFLKITDNFEDLKAAGEIIKNGGLVAFPTETVYGIGANGLNETAAKKIYEAKGRPSDNPLILHVNDINGAQKVGEVNEIAKILFETFSPGPLTVIIKKKEIVPDCTTGGLDTVAVRIPSAEIARRIIEYSGCPIAAPSANLSGKPSPTAFEHVKDDLNGRVDMIIDGGGIEVGIESTIIDSTKNPPVILRPGGITIEMVQEIFPDATEAKQPEAADENYKPPCPGMKYKHYAPKAHVTVFEKRELINEEIEKFRYENKKIGVFCHDDSSYDGDYIIKWGKTAKDMAKLMFWALREFDGQGMDVVLCEMPEKGGLGSGIRNRLYKSAGYDIRR